MAAQQQSGISLQVKIQVAPKDADAFLAALRPAYEAVSAEPECTYFEVFQDPQNPGTFKFIENWSKDAVWLENVQLKKEYYNEYRNTTTPMYIKPIEFEVYNRMPGNRWVASKKENFEVKN